MLPFFHRFIVPTSCVVLKPAWHKFRGWGFLRFLLLPRLWCHSGLKMMAASWRTPWKSPKNSGWWLITCTEMLSSRWVMVMQSDLIAARLPWEPPLVPTTSGIRSVYSREPVESCSSHREWMRDKYVPVSHRCGMVILHRTLDDPQGKQPYIGWPSQCSMVPPLASGVTQVESHLRLLRLVACYPFEEPAPASGNGRDYLVVKPDKGRRPDGIPRPWVRSPDCWSDLGKRHEIRLASFTDSFIGPRETEQHIFLWYSFHFFSFTFIECVTMFQTSP